MPRRRSVWPLSWRRRLLHVWRSVRPRLASPGDLHSPGQPVRPGAAHPGQPTEARPAAQGAGDLPGLQRARRLAGHRGDSVLRSGRRLRACRRSAAGGRIRLQHGPEAAPAILRHVRRLPGRVGSGQPAGPPAAQLAKPRARLRVPLPGSVRIRGRRRRQQVASGGRARRRQPVHLRRAGPGLRGGRARQQRRAGAGGEPQPGPGGVGRPGQHHPGVAGVPVRARGAGAAHAVLLRAHPVCMSALRSLLLVGFQDAQSATYSVVTYDLEDKSRQDHSPEDDHLDKLTGAAACPKLRLFATVSQDGTLRVWSSANQLLKAVQLHARPQGVAFCSDTGDLLLGIGASLYGIEHRRYLPKMQTRRMAMMHFEPAAPEPLSGEMDARLLAELPFPDRQRLLACRPAHSFDAFADPDPLEEEPDDVEERLAREAAFGTIASRERELRMLRDGDIKPKRRPAATPATKEEAFNKFLSLVADHPVLPPPPKEANLDAAVKSALEPPQLPRPKQAYRPDICPGFFPSQDAAVRPQAGLAPIPRGGCVPNSVLAKLLWPQEALLEHEKTATQASARGWRPPDLNVEQLRQLQGLRQRGSEDEAERQALLKSWADSGDGAGGDDEDEEEAGELLFELDADRKRREQQEQEQKEREQSDFMRRMQQAMDEAATEAAAEAAEAEAAAVAAAEAEAEAEAARTREASTVSGDSRRPPTRPTRRATQEELAAAARSRSSQSQASPKKRPPPPQKRPSEQRRSAVAASPTAASATASAAATPPSVSRQASEAALTGGQQQQTLQGPAAPPPLPDYVAQFADEDWFDAAFPEPRRRSLPDPLTPATFAGRLLRLLPGAGWPERSALCRAVQQLQTLESLGRQCQQEARRIVLELLELPPDCGVAEQRDFVRHGLTLLTRAGRTSRCSPSCCCGTSRATSSRRAS
ncbi:hypothetical protein BOX15_Mlig015780g3 [Macrostomum lignano]|uniref:Uncharacterized protein n=1 Tax=Macrostomum lignano TaxID=282301 RepID=A0A267HAE5_9PLAT|nr:hypothetical protein BOX15_Mlig015780g3 [Macrostomum lignano]